MLISRENLDLIKYRVIKDFKFIGFVVIEGVEECYFGFVRNCFEFEVDCFELV